MYRVSEELLLFEETETEIFGISDNNGLLITFTDDRKEAEKFVELCNENGVEPNHIADIIEDFFYT